MRFRDKIANFLRGRYGVDKFGMLLVWVALAILILNSFIHSLILYGLYFLALGYWIFRCLSKNIEQRRKENQAFEKILNKITSFFKLGFAKWKSRKTHKFIKCPRCKANLRLPKGKSGTTVVCPRCNSKFNVNKK